MSSSPVWTVLGDCLKNRKLKFLSKINYVYLYLLFIDPAIQVGIMLYNSIKSLFNKTSFILLAGIRLSNNLIKY